MESIPPQVAIAVLAVVGILVVRVVILARRTGRLPGTDVVVRCREGHLYTTIWIPLASFKAIRLGWFRFQYCPVGEHWSLVTPVPDDDLTERERWIASKYHDGPIP